MKILLDSARADIPAYCAICLLRKDEGAEIAFNVSLAGS
jgi:hypothetical protein